MKKCVRLIALIMALLMVCAVLFSCKNSEEGGDETDKSGNIVNGVGEEEDKYKDVDFGGKKFIIHTNISDGIYPASNRYVQGFDDMAQCQNNVDEAVYKRNTLMKENLNMDFEFINCNVIYDKVVSEIRPLINSGESYDLFINKLYPMANLSIEGAFLNVANNPKVNYFEKYWYNDFMTSLSLDGGSNMYLLAGDYFMDFIQSINIMMVNTEMLDSKFAAEGGSNAFLQKVIDGEWTYEMMMTYMKSAHSDNGDGVKNDYDEYGLTFNQYWAPMIPMISSTQLTYVEEVSGELKFALNNEKSIKLYDTMLKVLQHESSVPMIKITETAYETTLSEKDSLTRFQNGRSLFAMEQRFAHMAQMASVDLKYSVLPYPKLEATDGYLTAAHDTTEVGAIPNTCNDVDSVLYMLEIANDLTSQDVMVKYYDEGLKLKYSENSTVSQIVDIIHDNITDGFALAYGDQCSGVLQRKSFYDSFLNNVSFSTQCGSIEKMANSALKDLQNAWNKIG